MIACLNPFGTGQCLSTLSDGKGYVHCVSIPLEQGNVFRQAIKENFDTADSLNPFGTGQCLSTQNNTAISAVIMMSQSLWNRAMSFDIHFIDNLKRGVVSIPLEQGNVFRQSKS